MLPALSRGLKYGKPHQALTKFGVGLLQLKVSASKEDNLEQAKQKIAEAASQGADVIVLPVPMQPLVLTDQECFNCPYGNQFFAEYAEDISTGQSQSVGMLAKAARENEVYIIGGSIPERYDNKIFNCSMTFDPEGTLVAMHRKLHLFDINVPGKISFKESDTLTCGESATTFDTRFGRFGVGICYDIRFPELALLYRQRGCHFLAYPGAFNMTTGPAHWELLIRARAVDTQCFVAAVSPARDEKASYVAYGHSMLVSPWGEKLAECGEGEDLKVVGVDLEVLKEVRLSIPTSFQKRVDVYKVLDVAKETK